MSAKDRKAYVSACLEEYEAAAENFRRLGVSPDPAKAKVARAWGERQKRMLRALGHRKRMPVIGRKASPEEGSIFGEDDEEKTAGTAGGSQEGNAGQGAS